MITSVPAKPPATRIQRSGDTCSLSTVAASTVMASGAIITIAVNSPTGMYLRLANASRLLVSSSTPRSHWNRGLRVRSTDMPRTRQHRDGGRDRLERIAEPQRHQQRHRGADVLGGGVQRAEAGHRRRPPARCRPGHAARPAHWMRSASTSQTGVSSPGRQGSWPRSVWLSPGLWKSLPREAARPNSRAVSAYCHVLGRGVAAGHHFHALAAVGLELGEQRELLVGREPVTRRMRDHGHAAGAGDPLHGVPSAMPSGAARSRDCLR